MSPVKVEIRDAGPLDVEVEEELVEFEDETNPERRIESCLAEPWVTATTRVGCDWA
ncbi:SflA family class IV lanthipeptide [Embleya hyalina]|uniref:Uncharacterized protein n=1 Tax=Embleya hyalina TaxID=516124 RepID=A0A401YZS3_9ACTN|nr:SflA family class IV lanthipeptide [Embleya hyalina]GCE00133.1 hypothetical protein EHYA_07858 [Embleya hyalina]